MSAYPKDHINALLSDDPATRRKAADTLVAIHEEAIPALLTALRERPPSDYKPIILVLKRIGDPRAIEPLQQLANTTEDDLIRVLAGGAVRAIERQAKSTPPPPSEPRIDIPQHMSQTPKLRARVLIEPQPTQRPKAQRKVSAFEQKVIRHLELLVTPDYTARGDAANFFKFNARSAIPILQRRIAEGDRRAKHALDIARSAIKAKKAA
jgi:HEAT repeat protein